MERQLPCRVEGKVGEQGIGDQQLAFGVPGGGHGVGDLVPPAERPEVIASLPCRLQEHDPYVVDG